jgi:tetratricopeptide (TPR) repeat protein
MPTSLRLPDKDRKDILEDLAHKLAEQVQHDAKDSIGALMKLVDLGNAVADLGRAKDAVQYYSQALEGFEKILGNDLHPIPDVFMNLATVYYEQREYENAVQYHRRSLTGYAKASDQV